MTSPPEKPPADCIRQAILHLQTVQAKLLYHKHSYFQCHKEFWAGTARLAALAPPPDTDSDSTYFYRTLLTSLLKFSNHDRIADFQRNMLNISADRAELALEALDALLLGSD